MQSEFKPETRICEPTVIEAMLKPGPNVRQFSLRWKQDWDEEGDNELANRDVDKVGHNTEDRQGNFIKKGRRYGGW